MKQFTQPFIFFAFFSFFVFSGCKKPNDGVEPIINPTISESSVSIRLIDAKNNEEIKNSTVSIIGDDANLIFDNSGERPSLVKDGFLELIPVSSNEPTNSRPIRFSIKVEKEGYFSTLAPITIYKKGNQTIEIKLINKSTLVDGVGFTEKTYTLDSDQTLQQEEVLTAIPSNNGSGKAEVTIYKGSVFKDANNVPIKGNLKVELAYFNHLDDAIAAFPGGLEASTENNENIVFKSAGLVSLKMQQDSDGKIVKNISKPITMNITIPAGSTDSENKPIVVGTLIPVWSLNEITGKWKLEDTAKVFSDNGELKTEFKMSHLSYWNLDFKRNACNLGTTLKFQSSITKDYYTAATLKFSDGTTRFIYLNLKNGDETTLRNAPEGLSAELNLPEPFNTTFKINSLCSGTTVLTLNTALPSPIKVSIIGKCGTKVVKWPTLSVYAKENLGSNRWEYIGQMVDGNFETSKLKLGKTYVFGTFYNQLIVSDPITIDKTTYQVTKSLSATSKACGILTK